MGFVLVSAFVATAAYWLWMTLSNPGIYARGGLYYVFGAGVLAVMAFLVFRAFARWAARGDDL